MKKILLAVALVALMFVPQADAKMPLTIGAGSTGYGASVVDKGEHFTQFWAGLRTKELSENTAIYTTYQHIGMDGGEGGHGIKAMLVSGASDRWWSLMFDLGVAFDLALEGDGSQTTAVTVGGGFAFHLSEYISPFIYASSYDAGDRFSFAIHFGMAVRGLETLLPGK